MSKEDTNFLKAVECDAGEDCKHWRKPWFCTALGKLRLGGKGPNCLSFEQDYDHLRRALHEKVKR